MNYQFGVTGRGGAGAGGFNERVSWTLRTGGLDLRSRPLERRLHGRVEIQLEKL